MDLNDDGNGDGLGSAGDLLGSDAASSGAEASAAEGSGADGGQDGGDAGSGDPDWYGQLSADGDAADASLRDWVKAAGVKDLNGLAKIARDSMKALREGGRVKVPGEGASDAEIAEYRKAIGVPEKPDGYKMPVLKDAAGNDVQMNGDKLAFIAEKAHARGIPSSALEGVLQDIAEHDANELAGVEIELSKKADAHVKTWGGEKDAKLEAIDLAAKQFNLGKQDLLSLRAAWGPEKALDFLSTIGGGLREDTLVKGDSKLRFGGDPSSAQKRIDEIRSTPDLREKLMVPGSAVRNEYDRLLDIIGQEANRKSAEAS